MAITRRAWLGIGIVILVACAVVFVQTRRPTPDIAMAEVTRGEYVDVVEIRGLVRPRTSTVLTAPSQAGELQILTIVKNGSVLKKGDVAVEFDGAALERTIADKEQELKQALAEMEQLKARVNLGVGSNQLALLSTKYDVERAKLDTVSAIDGITSKVDQQKAELALADAKQRENLAKVRESADVRANTRGIEAQEKRISKVRGDLEKARWARGHLVVTSPATGVVNIMPNRRNNSGLGSPVEYRPGDTAFAGAEIIELPDMSAVRLEAGLDENDRGRVQAGQPAVVRVDAIADREFTTSVSEVSVLAKVDASSWPPSKNFALKLLFQDADARLRPGMSGVARITVGRLPDMLMLPSQSVFIVNGRPAVYALRGRTFAAVHVEIIRRSKDQVAVKGAVNAGDKVALTLPDAAARGEAK